MISVIELGKCSFRAGNGWLPDNAKPLPEPTLAETRLITNEVMQHSFQCNFITEMHFEINGWNFLNDTGLAVSHCPTARGKWNYQSGKWIWTDISSLFQNKQIEEFQNSWSRASDDFEKRRQALWHFQLRFLDWKYLYFGWKFSGVCHYQYQGSYW